MKASFKKGIKIGAITVSMLILVLLSLMFFGPKLYNNKINLLVRDLLKEKVEGEVNFDNLNLTFFAKFPYLTATISNPYIQGQKLDSLPEKTLFKADEVSLGVDIFSLFKGEVSLNQVFVDKANISVQVDSLGMANYSIFKTTDDTEEEDSALKLKIDRLDIRDANIDYVDLASNVSILITDLDYLGQGEMSNDIFDLKSLARIGNIDFIFGGVTYIKDKPVTAELITSVDTKSLTFGFNKNNIKIKNLPVDFKGHFGFVDGGYDMLFDIKTSNSKLDELLSILPPSYQKWLDLTTLEGNVTGSFLLKGEYNALKNTQPNLDFSLELDNGLVHYTPVKDALSDIFLDVAFKMENFDFETADLKLENLSFSLANKKSQLQLYTKGFTKPWLKANVDSEVDLNLLGKTLGITQVDMKGDLSLKGNLEGYYAKGIGMKRTLQGLKRDTIITSIPRFDLTAKLDNGYFKLAKLPAGINKMHVDLNAVAKDSLIKNVSLNLRNVDLVALDNYFKGHMHLKNLNNFDMNASIEANLDLETIKDFIPLKNFVLRGKFETKSTVVGTLEPRKKLYPVMHSDIKFINGYIQSLSIPELPIEDINVRTIIESKRGSMKDLSVRILPINFKLGGEPFEIAGSFYNLNDLQYEIKSKGVLNIGDFYKLFKIEGLDVRGKVITNLFLKGLQSDAVNGNFDKLKNGGKFEVDNIVIVSEYLPKELYIKKGVFKFFKEKMKFEKFDALYGKSKLSLDGYMTNVIGYVVKGDTLKGNFSLVSDYIDANEFMWNTTTTSNNTAGTAKQTSSSANETIVVPKELQLSFDANVKKIQYTDYILEDFTGNIGIGKGNVVLNQTVFNLIGTQVKMDGSYTPINKKTSLFTYNISAANFDIQKAYNGIPLFREMVSMAKDAYGIVSLDYSLEGKLDRNMAPILPSLKGKGTLGLDDIKFKGFKLLGAIGEKGESKSLENAKVEDVVIHSSIENNILTIERTRMKMAGFRPRFEGQVSLDGELNIGLRLGLPPLGVIGIPMRITGTADDFKIKMGQYKASEVMGREVEEDDSEDEEQQTENQENTQPISIPKED